MLTNVRAHPWPLTHRIELTARLLHQAKPVLYSKPKAYDFILRQWATVRYGPPQHVKAGHNLGKGLLAREDRIETSPVCAHDFAQLAERRVVNVVLGI